MVHNGISPLSLNVMLAYDIVPLSLGVMLYFGIVSLPIGVLIQYGIAPLPLCVMLHYGIIPLPLSAIGGPVYLSLKALLLLNVNCRCRIMLGPASRHPAPLYTPTLSFL